MTTFKNADWDFDVSGHECYQALFEESKQNSKFLKRSSKKSLKKGEPNSRVTEKIGKNIKKTIEESKSSPVIGCDEFISKSKKKRLKRLRRKLNNQNRCGENTQECEKSGINCNNHDTEDISENDQDKLVDKYHSELKSISRDSKRMEIEFAKEKRKQKKFKATLKALNQSQGTTNDKVKLKRKIIVSTDTIKTNGKQGGLISKKSQSNKEVKSLPDRFNNTGLKTRKFLEKLKETLKDAKQVEPVPTLRQKMMEKLKAARFRFLNEEIYTSDSKEAQKIFQNDPDAFKAYHDGYRQQVKRWPLNPLDVIIRSVKKLPKNLVVADFGCGDARLSRSIPQEVFSFDLVAVNESVTECDMSKVPLEDSVIDVAVFCLSLMGTNLRDYLREAHRVMKVGGILKIAEVESRFEDVDAFIADMQKYGFRNTLKDLSHNLFYFLDFKKDDSLGNKKNLPKLTLLPCLYKKR